MADILNCEFSAQALDQQYCVLSVPVEINNSYQYSIMNCSSTLAFSKMNCSSTAIDTISDGTSTFYLEKTLSYGDFFVIFFFVVLFLAIIFDFIFRFIYKIKVNFRH